MCERIAQYRLKQAYADAMGWPADAFPERSGDRIAHWNVPPGSQPWLMHRLRSGRGSIEMVNWGYRPDWAIGAGVPLAASVRLDQAMVGPYLKPLFNAGRAVVPVDGWYEWTKVAGVRQPWFVQRISRQPMFIPAVSSFRLHNPSAEGTGFVLVCDSTQGGLVDPCEQRPIVLTAEAAAIWMDPDTPPARAARVAQSCPINESDFEWFKVTLDVNRYARNGSELIAPLAAGGQA